ncbi:MAG: glycosyltransferase family 2 protein [Pseudomonadota bacterium]
MSGTFDEVHQAYRLRWRRRRLRFRGLRKFSQLRTVVNRCGTIRPGDVLLFSTVRNEAARLPHFLHHYRTLGVAHFLIVDNQSTDGTRDFLSDMPDVSLWSANASYKRARFGMDWLTCLQFRYGAGHWCLTVDADEILIYPNHLTRPLPALVDWLDQNDRDSFGALMLDLYPKGALSTQNYASGDTPFAKLCWFDAGNYHMRRKPDLHNLWIQGGVRARKFFSADPGRAPTLGKIPLVKWSRRYVYVSSTHSLLPRRLNVVYDENGGEMISGVLLHTKFLDTVVARSAEEKRRGEHFENSDLYDAYYDALTADPDLWCARSTRLTGWRQLEALGLMSRGGWV